jgi:hypothetical protein
MFRTLTCPSSGGQIVLSSLSVNSCTVCRLRTDCSLFSAGILYKPFTESDDTRCCDNTICPPEDEHINARNMSRIVMWHTYFYGIKELCIKLVIETSLLFPLSVSRRVSDLKISGTVIFLPFSKV